MNNCKIHKSCNLESNRIQHYIKRLGPVIYGVKPIHLFSFADIKSFQQEHIKELKHAFDNCKKLDYLVIECYFEYFMDELKKNIIPHEMGLFFGYPLKDVMGFMGMTRLKHIKTKGWKVFGDPRLSDEKFLAFEEAEKRIWSFASITPVELLMSGAF